jgi:hypothetical protein
MKAVSMPHIDGIITYLVLRLLAAAKDELGLGWKDQSKHFAAVVDRDGKFYSTARNGTKRSKGDSSDGRFLHAEEIALIRALKKLTGNVPTLYLIVIRIGVNGDLLGVSRPCNNCSDVLRRWNRRYAYKVAGTYFNVGDAGIRYIATENLLECSTLSTYYARRATLRK